MQIRFDSCTHCHRNEEWLVKSRNHGVKESYDFLKSLWRLKWNKAYTNYLLAFNFTSCVLAVTGDSARRWFNGQPEVSSQSKERCNMSNRLYLLSTKHELTNLLMTLHQDPFMWRKFCMQCTLICNHLFTIHHCSSIHLLHDALCESLK